MQRRWKSDGKKGDEEKTELPFNIQLFESVAQRVQKAKEEETRHAQLHQRTARGRFFATLFGRLRMMVQKQVHGTNMEYSYRRHF